MSAGVPHRSDTETSPSSFLSSCTLRHTTPLPCVLHHPDFLWPRISIFNKMVATSWSSKPPNLQARLKLSQHTLVELWLSGCAFSWKAKASSSAERAREFPPTSTSRHQRWVLRSLAREDKQHLHTSSPPLYILLFIFLFTSMHWLDMEFSVSCVFALHLHWSFWEF
jgi:hypothetical protein